MEEIQYPHEFFTCSTGEQLVTPADFSVDDYQQVVNAVNAKFDSLIAEDPDLRQRIPGCLVRMAGHDFMDYRDDDGVETGGSDGCLSFYDPDNGGLQNCLTEFQIPQVFE